MLQRCGFDPVLAQWVKVSNIATAAAWIQSLAQELPYATDVVTKLKKKKKKRERERETLFPKIWSVCRETTRDRMAPENYYHSQVQRDREEVIRGIQKKKFL